MTEQEELRTWEVREATAGGTHDWIPAARPAGTIGCVTDGGGWAMFPVTHECSRCGLQCSGGRLTLRIVEDKHRAHETCGEAVVRKVMES